jgi:hypothetical protein
MVSGHSAFENLAESSIATTSALRCICETRLRASIT